MCINVNKRSHKKNKSCASKHLQDHSGDRNTHDHAGSLLISANYLSRESGRAWEDWCLWVRDQRLR